MDLRDRARRRMMGKLARLADGQDDPTLPNGFRPGIVVDLDYEHVIHPDRAPRDNPDSGLVVKLAYDSGRHGTYWYHAYDTWQVFGESELIDPYNP